MSYLMISGEPEEGLGDLFRRIVDYQDTQFPEFAAGYGYAYVARDLDNWEASYRTFWYNYEDSDAWIWDDGMPDPINPADTALLSASTRDRRDLLLAECDWTQLSDVDLTAVSKSNFATYRQNLRDVPQQGTFPTLVTWPTRPAEVKT